MLKIHDQQYELVDASTLTLHPDNPNQADMVALKESIEVNGFYGAVTANRRTRHVLTGNHRTMALVSLQSGTIPTLWIDVSEEEEKRILVVDNELTRRGKNDADRLTSLLQSLTTTPLGLAGTGYTNDNLAALLAALRPPTPPPALTDPDQVPTLPETESRCKYGDLWQLGPHRLLIGDSMNPADVARLMDGQKSEMVWTDPPYGVGIGDKNAFLNSIARSNRIEENLENDNLDEPALIAMLRASFANALAHNAPGGAWYVAAPAGPLHIPFGMVLKEMGIYRQTLIWVKNNATFSPMGVVYHWRHEPLCFGWSPGAGHRAYGGRTQDTVWEIDRPVASPEHPTMKPVLLITRAIENSSKVGEIVYDAFAGSGTTIIAATRTNRRAFAIEISPKYAAVCINRYEQHTGQEAIKCP